MAQTCVHCGEWGTLRSVVVNEKVTQFIWECVYCRTLGWERYEKPVKADP